MLREATHHLLELLPPSWKVELLIGPPAVRGRELDALLTLRTPRGVKIDFVVEAKLSTQRFSVPQILNHLRAVAAGRPCLIITDYANPALRKGCEEAGLSYLDVTGWTYLREDDAGLFIRRQGTSRPPTPPVKRGTAMVHLDGPGASQVIRTLWAARLPVGVRDLAAAAGVSPGTVAKVLPALASYGAIARTSEGTVAEVNRRLLIERWTQDYAIYDTNPEVLWLLAPRGPDHAFASLAQLHAPAGALDDGIALTGYVGALSNLPREPEETYPVIPHTLLAIYSEDPSRLAEALRLRKATPTTANVVIIRPKDSRLLQPYPLAVPLPQVLADLLTMGGRFIELAEQLFETIDSQPSIT